MIANCSELGKRLPVNPLTSWGKMILCAFFATKFFVHYRNNGANAPLFWGLVHTYESVGFVLFRVSGIQMRSSSGCHCQNAKRISISQAVLVLVPTVALNNGFGACDFAFSLCINEVSLDTYECSVLTFFFL